MITIRAILHQTTVKETKTARATITRTDRAAATAKATRTGTATGTAAGQVLGMARKSLRVQGRSVLIRGKMIEDGELTMARRDLLLFSILHPLYSAPHSIAPST